MGHETISLIVKEEIATGTVFLRSDGIIEWNMRSGLGELTLENSKEFMAAFARLAGGRRRPGFIVVPHYVPVSREVQEFFASDELNKYTSANAFVMNSLPAKLIANFYIRFFRPARPTRIFNDMGNAVEWLKQFL